MHTPATTAAVSSLQTYSGIFSGFEGG